ncbi:MAG: DEAD/DEAH box helicase, partial [Fusobacteriaceae bacterium]
ALKKLDELVESGENKALIISATGTGKTYLSAFHVKKFNPKKFLFIVHRENIAKAAKKTFQNIFGDEKTMGLYSGNKKGTEDYLFSTVQTLSKQEHLNKFHPEYFDYIVIDETHRVAAESYQKIIKYFKPKFLLGMTATPERTDNCDIFKEFDHNVAYEIRLQRALEEEMLVPFHYYGVTDIETDNEINEEKRVFNYIPKNERVDKIIEKAELYGCDNGDIRGLVFCSKIESAIYFSNEFNKRGYRTLSLSGANTIEERESAITRLQTSSFEKLDYIFTVDIFNEGIDIPKINQIIMLRGTESHIVFIQQLGRGLRKSKDKDYLTVIDFIGNYKNNYLIPIALFGETSYNKDNLRSLMVKGNSMLPGSSTVNFDEISKERIFHSIDQSKINQKSNLLEEYKFLKAKLGRSPMMVDFLENNL